MATRQPRRTRRRTAPAQSLPRPTTTDDTPVAEAQERSSRRIGTHRTHHIATDYSYVKRDLLTIGWVGTVCIAFVVAMYFVVQ